MCTHVRKLTLAASSNDRNNVNVFDGSEETHKVDCDYLPHIDGLCGGDDLAITICLDCGMVISREFPITAEELDEAFGNG